MTIPEIFCIFCFFCETAAGPLVKKWNASVSTKQSPTFPRDTKERCTENAVVLFDHSWHGRVHNSARTPHNMISKTGASEGVSSSRPDRQGGVMPTGTLPAARCSSERVLAEGVVLHVEPLRVADLLRPNNPR